MTQSMTLASPGDDLQRFVDAQAPVIATVEAELRAGAKRTHWMWFVFPQLRGLGQSVNAYLYGIGGVAEARAYLAHPVLGPRLRHCTALVNRVEHRTAHEIFGTPDDLKFHSSITLFAHVAPEITAEFATALAKYFGNQPDARTIALLA